MQFNSIRYEIRGNAQTLAAAIIPLPFHGISVFFFGDLIIEGMNHDRYFATDENRDETNSPDAGCVSLVGAGPGDPGLITVRGCELLGRADVVLYDFLVNPLVLEPVQPQTELICLGRHGTGRILPQSEINQKMIDFAKQGRRVVRLKGGDPAVFGRLAEEVAALEAAGVSWEVVPGISAALAAPSYAGVFMTHREHASAVAMVTGHEQASENSPKLDFKSLARFPGTLIFYMGVTTASEWTSALISAGRDANAPAAIVRRCSWTDQEVIHCTLEEVPQQISSRKLRPPAVILIGCAAERLAVPAWFSRRPLLGQTILITRPRSQAFDLSRRLTELGAGCLVHPVIDIVPPADWSAADEAMRRIDEYDWLVFSSVNGVHFFLDRFYSMHGDLRGLGNIRLAAIGPQTATALGSYHLKVDLQPEEFCADALGDQLVHEAHKADEKRFLLARASRGREVLAEKLQAAGGLVDQVIVYQSLDVQQVDADVRHALANQEIDWITVTSSAIARSLVSLFGDLLGGTRLASISPITSATLRELGYEPAVEAVDYTMEGLVAAICRSVGQNG